MLRPVILTILLFFSGLSFGQNPESFIKVRNPNLRYLEHLIKMKVDSIRESNKLNPFANDSLLYVVSTDHAKYCAKADKSTHSEIDASKATPETRIIHAGGSNYQSAELLGDCYIHHPIQKIGRKAKSGQKMEIKTYGAAADYIIYHWVKSPLIMRYIKDKKFLTIGCAVQLNKVSDHLMIVCMLGRPYLQYSFTEYKRFFPFSKFEMYSTPQSFKQAKNVTPQVYPQKLKVASGPSVYEEYEKSFNEVDFKIVEEKGGVYLEATNLEALKQMLSANKNGLLLEMVDYETFHAGNPEYYTKASKRNGKGLFSGQTIGPRFSGLLLQGIDEKNGKWRVLMGKKPPIIGHYEWNVWLICNKKICIKRHFFNYCGEPLALYKELPLKDHLRKEEYPINFDFDTNYVEVKFDDGEFELTNGRLRKLKEAIDENTDGYEYLKIDVIYTNPVIALGRKMVPKYEKAKKVFLDTLKNSVYSDTKVSSEDTLDWQLLDRLIQAEEDSSLMGITKEQMNDSLKLSKFAKKYYKDLWEDLRVYVRVVHYHDTIKELFRQYDRNLNTFAAEDTIDTKQVEEMEKLQNTLFDVAKEEEMDPKIFMKYNAIARKPELARLINNQAWYIYTNVYEKDKDKEVLKEFYSLIKYAGHEVPKPHPLHRYNHFAFSLNRWTSKHSYDKKFKSKQIKAAYKKLVNHEDVLGDTKPLKAALYIKAANYYNHFKNSEKADKLREEMVEGIIEIYSSTQNRDTLRDLAYTMIHYGRAEYALDILRPLINSGWKDKEALKLYLKLAFVHVPPNPKDINMPFYQKLMQSIDVIGTAEWCDMFVGPCNISFQSFEYEPLRRLYCGKCAGRGNYASE